jgi:hypothetical protein
LGLVSHCAINDVSHWLESIMSFAAGWRNLLVLAVGYLVGVADWLTSLRSSPDDALLFVNGGPAVGT